jgi:hypothetical protein
MVGLVVSPGQPNVFEFPPKRYGRNITNPPVPVVATVGYVGSRTIKNLDLVRADGTGGCRTDAR